MVRMLPLIVLAGAIGTGAHAASPTKTERATYGRVRVAVTYRLLHSNRWDVRLVIERAGRRVYDGRVPPDAQVAAWRGWNEPVGVLGDKTITLADLDGEGEPEVLLNFYSVGAHCCWWTRIYRWDPAAGIYTNAPHFWGDVSYRLIENRTGGREFVSADDRFAYAFSSFAGSSFPIQVWSYLRGRLVDSTRKRPVLVARDAARQWRWFERANSKRPRWERRGLLAAWTADECLLGRCTAAFAWLQQHRRAFTGFYDNRSATAATYLKPLRRFLHHTGYVNSASTHAPSR